MEKLYYSPTEAAEVLGISPNKAYELVKAGVIPATRKLGNWKVPKELLKHSLEGWSTEEAEERRKEHERNY